MFIRITRTETCSIEIIQAIAIAYVRKLYRSALKSLSTMAPGPRTASLEEFDLVALLLVALHLLHLLAVSTVHHDRLPVVPMSVSRLGISPLHPMDVGIHLLLHRVLQERLALRSEERKELASHLQILDPVLSLDHRSGHLRSADRSLSLGDLGVIVGLTPPCHS